MFSIKLVLMHSSPACLCKNNGWVPSSLGLPLSLCSPDWGNGPDPVCICVHPWSVQDSLWGHLSCISLFSSQGEQCLQLSSAVFGQRHGLFVSLDCCSTAGRISDIQVTSGSASDGLLQVSTSHRCCLTALVQMGITQSKTWVQKMITKVSWSFQKHCKF